MPITSALGCRFLTAFPTNNPVVNNTFSSLVNFFSAKTNASSLPSFFKETVSSGPNCLLNSDNGCPLQETLKLLYQPNGARKTTNFSARNFCSACFIKSSATLGSDNVELRCAYGYNTKVLALTCWAMFFTSCRYFCITAETFSSSFFSTAEKTTKHSSTLTRLPFSTPSSAAENAFFLASNSIKSAWMVSIFIEMMNYSWVFKYYSGRVDFHNKTYK